MKRVLIADDMVPDITLTSEQEVAAYYSKLYPGKDFADGCIFVHRLLNLLRSEGYRVDVANASEEALHLAKSRSYDVIVLDLGWWTENDMVRGFDMADKIQATCSAQIVMYSNRFFENEKLAERAAEKNCLPVFKSYDNDSATDLSVKSLLVTIRWAVYRRTTKAKARDEVRLFSLNKYKQFSNLLLVSTPFAILLLFAAVVYAIKDKTPASILASIFGTVTVFLNGSLYRYVSEFRDKSIS